MTNKEKFLLLVTEDDGGATMREIEYRHKHRARLKESFMIGFKVLMKLDELKWSQKDLAAAMEVTPQQINKIVRGKQNLTLETIVKLQEVLKIPILASSYERAMNKSQQVKHYKADEAIPYIPEKISVSGTYQHASGKPYKISMVFNKMSELYTNKIAS